MVVMQTRRLIDPPLSDNDGSFICKMRLVGAVPAGIAIFVLKASFQLTPASSVDINLAWGIDGAGSLGLVLVDPTHAPSA